MANQYFNSKVVKSNLLKAFEEMSNDQLVELHNWFCDKNDYREDKWYPNDKEHRLQELVSVEIDGEEYIKAELAAEYSPNMDYFQYNGYDIEFSDKPWEDDGFYEPKYLNIYIAQEYNSVDELEYLFKGDLKFTGIDPDDIWSYYDEFHEIDRQIRQAMTGKQYWLEFDGIDGEWYWDYNPEQNELQLGTVTNAGFAPGEFSMEFDEDFTVDENLQEFISQAEEWLRNHQD